MRALCIAVAFLFASASAYAGEEPTDHPTQTEKDISTSLVVVACKVMDLTGTRVPPGDPDAIVMPSPGWRDLELYINPKSLEYECKREILDLEDAVAANYPSKPYAIAGPPICSPRTTRRPRIDLSTIDARQSLAGDQAFIFIGTAPFGGSGGQLRQTNNVIQGDVNGDKVADFEIVWNFTGSNLIGSDFIL